VRPYLFLIPIALCFSLSAASFKDNFSQAKWSGWGDARHHYDFSTGHNSKGSLFISAQPGQEGTFHTKLTNLNGRRVKVTAWVRGERIQEGKWKTSFWHFHASRSSERTVFRNLTGSFGWSRITYTADIKGGELLLWFRLKGAGRVWIDDLEVTPYQGKPIPFSIKKVALTGGRHHTISSPKECYQQQKIERHTLYNFTNQQAGPFDSIVVSNRNDRAAKLSAHQYYRFDLKKFKSIEWRRFDYLELDLFVPPTSNKTPLKFYFVVADSKSRGYWSQLNWTSSLATGWNHLRFPLHRTVGERGSFTISRKIDYDRLKSLWLVVDPDRKERTRDDLLIDNLSLTQRVRPKFFKELIAFDFIDQPEHLATCFTPVTGQHIYQSGDQYGLQNSTIWRVHDSKYADTLNRDAISITKGNFIVKLKNGSYRMALNWNMLGTWEIPFWKKRVLTVQGQPVRGGLRSTPQDYLDSFLRFEFVEPAPGDHPWDLYLAPIFKPIEVDFKVTNGVLKIVIDSDPTGAAINWLMIWPKDKDRQMKKFRAELQLAQKIDYSGLVREVKLSNNSNQKRDQLVTLLPEVTRISPDQTFQKSKQLSEIKTAAVKGSELIYPLIVRLNQKERVKVSIAPLKGEGDGVTIRSGVFRGQYQYISYDINHETYALNTRILRPIKSSFNSSAGINQQLLLKFYITKSTPAGSYHSKVSVKSKNRNWSFPISIKVLNHSLPKIEFPVGFLGLNPTPFSYYNVAGVEQRREESSYLALKSLFERGFTTWSGLPSIQPRGSWDPDTIDRLFKRAKKLGLDGPVFSYGGKFPYELLKESFSRSEGKALGDRLGQLLRSSKWPEIVVNFSDEAAGYSNVVERDIKRGEQLEKYFPFFRRGGFSTMDKKASLIRLHSLFSDGSYSNYVESEAKQLEARGLSWGNYNAASAPFDNPRYSFGMGLFIARKLGLSHRLGWHMSAIQNYPYFDLDGRENDAAMIYPSSSGKLLSTIKYEQATQGILDFRLIKLLEQHAQHSPRIRAWLNRNIDLKQERSRPKLLSRPRRATPTTYQLRQQMLELLGSI
jgi:hypothetical protein